MKVMRIITRLNVGGPALHASLLDEGLERYGIETVLVTGQLGRTEGDMSYLFAQRRKTPLFVPELGREINPFVDIVCLWKLFRIMRRERPDIVHTHMAKAGTLGRLAALLAGVPVRIHTFHGHVFQGYFRPLTARFFVALERFLAGRSDCLIAVSDHVRAEVCHRYRIGSPGRVRTIPIGLELGPFLQVNGRSGCLREELGLSSQTRLIGIVGRLVPIKHHTFFLEAAEMLAKRHEDVHFVIVGGGEEEPRLKRWVHEKSLSRLVSFLGWRRNLPHVYADLDIVVLTSRNEGTPVSLIEAMASGKAVVGTRVGGVADVVQDGVTGYAVSADDLQAFVDKVGLLLERPDLRERLGRKGREWVRGRFSKEQLLENIRTLYEELLTKTGRGKK